MKTIIILSSLLTAVLTAKAGPSTSGGGIGVLCKTSDSQTLKILDLYEADLIGQKLIQSTNSFGDDYAVGLTRHRTLAGDPRPVSKTDIDNMLGMFYKYTQFTDEALPLTQDYGSTVTLPTNCQFIQIGIYDDFNERFLLNRNLWEQLDSLNRAALVTHESIYKLQRIAFYGNSFQARRLVRELFLFDGPKMKGVYEGLTKGKGLICFAGDSGTNNSITFVWQDNQIHLITFAGEQRYVKTTLKVPLSVENIKFEPELLGDSTMGYKITSTPQDFEIKTSYFESEMPMSHITWSQTVMKGEIFRVGMNVNGRVLSFPVSGCFNYK